MVVRSDRGHVETMATGPGGQIELLPPVDEMRTVIRARHRLQDKCLVFECDETPVEIMTQNTSKCNQSSSDTPGSDDVALIPVIEN